MAVVANANTNVSARRTTKSFFILFSSCGIMFAGTGQLVCPPSDQCGAGLAAGMLSVYLIWRKDGE